MGRETSVLLNGRLFRLGSGSMFVTFLAHLIDAVATHMLWLPPPSHQVRCAVIQQWLCTATLCGERVELDEAAVAVQALTSPTSRPAPSGGVTCGAAMATSDRDGTGHVRTDFDADRDQDIVKLLCAGAVSVKHPRSLPPNVPFHFVLSLGSLTLSVFRGLSRSGGRHSCLCQSYRYRRRFVCSGMSCGRPCESRCIAVTSVA